MIRKEKGFTLIELLVVIAIVAVLAGALLIAINPQSMIQKSRDSKRLQDVDTLVKALNLALADGELLLADTSSCTTCDSASGTTAVDSTGYVQYTTILNKTGLSKFIPTLPTDPINGACTNAAGNAATCVYSFGSDGTNFEVNAVLEHSDNVGKLGSDGGDAAEVYEAGTGLTVL